MARARLGDDLTLLEHEDAVAEALDRRQVVRDEHDRAPLDRGLAHLLQGASLEVHVPDGEHLVDDEDLGIEVGGDREGQAHEHAARVALHRRVDEGPDAGEVDDLLVAVEDVPSTEAQQRPVEEDVLAPRELGVKAGSDLEQRGRPAVELDASLGRQRDARQQLEHRALAGAVAADDPDRLAVVNVEADVLQRPELRPSRARLLGVGDVLDRRAPAEEVPDGREHRVVQPLGEQSRRRHLPAPIELADAARSDCDSRLR